MVGDLQPTEPGGVEERGREGVAGGAVGRGRAEAAAERERLRAASSTVPSRRRTAAASASPRAARGTWTVYDESCCRMPSARASASVNEDFADDRAHPGGPVGRRDRAHERDRDVARRVAGAGVRAHHLRAPGDERDGGRLRTVDLRAHELPTRDARQGVCLDRGSQLVTGPTCPQEVAVRRRREVEGRLAEAELDRRRHGRVGEPPDEALDGRGADLRRHLGHLELHGGVVGEVGVPERRPGRPRIEHEAGTRRSDVEGVVPEEHRPVARLASGTDGRERASTTRAGPGPGSRRARRRSRSCSRPTAARAASSARLPPCGPRRRSRPRGPRPPARPAACGR